MLLALLIMSVLLNLDFLALIVYLLITEQEVYNQGITDGQKVTQGTGNRSNSIKTTRTIASLGSKCKKESHKVRVLEMVPEEQSIRIRHK